jgi:DNA-binding response OmpR family regulator
MNALFSSALIVEDEPNLLITLQVAFRKLSIPIRSASTLQIAQDLFKVSPPEFILLDRNLPDGDGLHFCITLRGSGYTGTILILTASGEIEDRVQGLDAGADDYLPKPFSWEELEARIRALSRRKNLNYSKNTENLLWQLDSKQLRILGPKGWIELTPLEFKLASRLIGSQSAIISRDELLKDVWGFTLLPKTRTVDHFLGRLRKYFEVDPENPRYFITIRGAGYRFQGSSPPLSS